MTSGRNYSGSQLRRIFNARHNMLFQVLDEQFIALRKRFQHFFEQTGSLTTEQQNLNNRVLIVYNVFVKARSLFLPVKLFLDYYDRSQQNDQPQLCDQMVALIADQAKTLEQTAAKIAGIGVKLQNLEGRLRELKGISFTASQ